MFNKSLLVIIIILGFIIRLKLISIPGFSYDIGSWFAWASRLDQVEISNFYSDEVFSDYLPGYLYILKLLGFLKSSFNFSDSLFYPVLKLPAILAEAGIGILIFIILKKEGFKTTAYLGSLFFLLNPAIIFNSAIWGQIDGVLTVFLLIALYFLEEKNLVFSSIFLAIAFMIKPQAVSIAPIFLFYLIKNFSIVNFIKIILPGVITILILSLPFFPDDPTYGIYNKVVQAADEYPYTSLNAYNFWGMVGFWVPEAKTWNGLSYLSWGYLIFGLYWLICTFFYFKGKLTIYQLAGLATLAFFFLPTKVHERYLYPALIFLIIVAFQLKSKALIILTANLSLLHFANLYFVYIYYNKIQLNFTDKIYVKDFYDILVLHPFILSLSSIIIFLIISMTIIKLSYDHKENAH